MDYVKHFDINGVDTRQVACIELHGKPNAATEGRVGVLGIDLDSPTHEVYKCVAVNGAIYTWELLSSGLSMISSTLTSGGVESMQFPYDRLQTPSLYMVKIGDLILDRYGYLYQVTALYSSYCDATYCGIQIVAHCPSGVYLGTETPPEGVEVWVDPRCESGETEEWIFTLEDGTTVTKKQLSIDTQMKILRLKNAEGKWVEVPALIGAKGDTGVGIERIEQTTTSTDDDGDNIVTVTLTNGVEVTFTVQNGSKGNKGDTGDTGVGVQSVEQTTTSNEDDGNNVITVTLTNGEKFTFTVQNGSKGSTGETGKTGETGADGVSVQSVTQTTTSDADGGDNVITVTLTNGVKSTFIVKNGSKGGTGSPGANGKSAYDYAKDGGFTGTEAEFIAKLATAYLPLSGGTMTGEITLPNNTSLKSKNPSGTAQEMLRANGSNQLILGAKDAWDLIVMYHGMVPATVAVDSLDIGAAGRRWKNLYLSGVLSDGTNSIAIADIPNTTENWTFTLEDGTTVTKAVYIG